MGDLQRALYESDAVRAKAAGYSSPLDRELAEAMYAINRALSYFPIWRENTIHARHRDRGPKAVKRQQLLDMRDHVADIRMQLDPTLKL